MNPVSEVNELIDAVFSDRDILPAEVPQLDLYMDQVLSLFDQCLSGSKRAPLTGRGDVDFAACYDALLSSKERMREVIPALLREHLPADPTDPSERLTLCLMLSEIANYLRRLCESMIDAIPPQTEGE